MINQNDVINLPIADQILKHHGLKLKKSLGQNFLTDTSVVDEIIASSELDPNDQVIEIGPGIGALTQQIAKSKAQVTAYEIDQRLMPILEDTLQDYPNVLVVNEDILKADFSQNDVTSPVKVIANLPYYITTKIITGLMDSKLPVEMFVIMMQKEVAERITAPVGDSEYGALSVIMQEHFNGSIKRIVKASSFIPEPNVDSAVLKLSIKDQTDIPDNELAEFRKFVFAVFAKRRKTLLNNLVNYYGKDRKNSILEKLAKLQIEPQIRPQNLSASEYVDLYKTFRNQE